MTIGFALCGSFCTYGKVFPILEELTLAICIEYVLS